MVSLDGEHFYNKKQNNYQIEGKFHFPLSIIYAEKGNRIADSIQRILK